MPSWLHPPPAAAANRSVTAWENSDTIQPMKDFRNLKVWEKAHQLALALYHITASFPREETYGLASQIRRAASSIPANIAEGCGREGDPELAQLLRYRQRLRQRTGISTPAGSRSETDPAQRLRNTVRADCRDQTH